MMTAPTLKQLRELAKVESEAGFDGPLEAIRYAENNANETTLTEVYDYERVAYDGICCTGPFKENKAVRNWFAVNGYTWC